MAASAIRFELKKADLEKAIAALKSRSIPGIVRSLNRAAVSTRTLMVRSVAADLGIKQKDVPIAVRNASASRLEAQVIASGKRIPLIKFSARQTKRGVTARLKGGAGKYPNAFIATMPTGHQGVYQRRPGARRLPIYELFGPSIPFVFDKYKKQGLDRGFEQLVKNLIHELRFAATQSAG